MALSQQRCKSATLGFSNETTLNASKPPVNVGVIGLGAMGRGMAHSLRQAGYPVHVCDARPEAAQAFAKEGGVACENPAALAALCPVVIAWW